MYERKQDKQEPVTILQQISPAFMDRVRTTLPTREDIALAAESFGEDMPDDVLEELARQQSVARPILEQYHLFHEATPTLAMARATAMSEMDGIIDIVTAMDLTDMSDVGEFEDEYTCPRCAHRWSGAPNYKTGYGDKVYVPTGRISKRTGRPLNKRYGPPRKAVPNFKYGRNWRGSSAAKLPRGFGNRPIGEPIVGENWRKKKRTWDYDETSK